MLAWHFLKEDMKMRYGSNELVKPNKTYRVNPDKLSLCEYGLHASIKPVDALSYAPGPIICRAKLGGKILKSNDKVCASERTVLWMADAEYLLYEFAIWCAYDVLPIFEKQYPTDKRPRKAIEAKEAWLKMKISDEDLTAARAASDVARAAGDVAWAARAARAKQNKWLEQHLLELNDLSL